MKVLNPKSLKFLEEYLNNAAPTGYESNGQKIWMKYLKPYVDEFITDNYGTAVGVINPEKKFKVVIEGHSDEISWYVNYITDNGLIYVIRNGGSDHQIAPSKWVNIHTKKGIVKGVFGWPAIHVRDHAKEAPPKIDNIFIDIGAKDKKEVEKMGVHVGCVITYPDSFHILNKNKFVCRAIDNRAGGFMIAEVARLIKENKDKLQPDLNNYHIVQIGENLTEISSKYNLKIEYLLEINNLKNPDSIKVGEKILLSKNSTSNAENPQIIKNKKKNELLELDKQIYGPIIIKSKSYANNEDRKVLNVLNQENQKLILSINCDSNVLDVRIPGRKWRGEEPAKEEFEKNLIDDFCQKF